MLISVPLSAVAQEFTDSLRFAELRWSMKKKALVLEYMDLTEAEKASFWPVYDHYSLATKHLELECVYLMSSYARNFDELSPRELDDLLKRILRNDITLAKLRRVYFRKFKKALSAEQAVTFMQLDHTFRTMIRMNVKRGWPPMELVRGSLVGRNPIQLTDKD